MASAERTLVKSQPELWEQLDRPERMQGLMSALLGGATEIRVLERRPETRLAWSASAAEELGKIEVALEKKGWGTQVEITAEASPERGGLEGWLEAVFEELSAPERRPFDGIV